MIAIGDWQSAAAQTPVPPVSVQQLQRGQQTQLDLSSPLPLERVLARFLERNLAVEAARYRIESTRGCR